MRQQAPTTGDSATNSDCVVSPHTSTQQGESRGASGFCGDRHSQRAAEPREHSHPRMCNDPPGVSIASSSSTSLGSKRRQLRRLLSLSVEFPGTSSTEPPRALEAVETVAIQMPVGCQNRMANAHSEGEIAGKFEEQDRSTWRQIATRARSFQGSSGGSTNGIVHALTHSNSSSKYRHGRCLREDCALLPCSKGFAAESSELLDMLQEDRPGTHTWEDLEEYFGTAHDDEWCRVDAFLRGTEVLSTREKIQVRNIWTPSTALRFPALGWCPEEGTEPLTEVRRAEGACGRTAMQR